MGDLVYNEELKFGTDIRAEELEKFGKIIHKRLNGDNWRTAFSYEIRNKLGENLVLISRERYRNNKEIAKKCFDLWKSNDGH